MKKSMNIFFASLFLLAHAASADPAADLAAELKIYKQACPSNLQRFTSGFKAGATMAGKTVTSPFVAVVGLPLVLVEPLQSYVDWLQDAEPSEYIGFRERFSEHMRRNGLTKDTYLDPIKKQGAVSAECAKSIERLAKIRDLMNRKVAANSKNVEISGDVAQNTLKEKRLPASVIGSINETKQTPHSYTSGDAK